MPVGLPIAEVVFWGIITFSLLVVIHEGGHFLAARAFGVKVHEFMIGLPGPAIRLRGRHTTFGVTAIPLGGYVRIAGMEPGAEDPLLATALSVAARGNGADEARRERINAVELAAELHVDEARAARLLATLLDYGALRAAEDDDVSYLPAAEPLEGETPDETLARVRSGTYRGKKTWQRVTILAMGVLTNLVTAVLVLTVVLALFGYYEASLRIGEVLPDSGAAAAGLDAGDELVAIDGRRLSGFPDLLLQVSRHKPGQEVTVDYVRGGRRATARVALGSAGDGEKADQPLLGIRPASVKRTFGPIAAFAESLRFVALTFAAIGSFFNPETFRFAVGNSQSVVGASVYVAEAAKAGPIDYAYIVAVLSLSLGAINLVPIPPLDGGKIVVEFIERIIGRPLRREVSLGLSVAGALLLFSLIGYLMYADVTRLSGG